MPDIDCAHSGESSTFRDVGDGVTIDQDIRTLLFKESADHGFRDAAPAMSAHCPAGRRCAVGLTHVRETVAPNCNRGSKWTPKRGIRRVMSTRSGFVAGSDSAQQLLALCHAAVSDPWYLEGRFRELIACATRN